MKTKLLFTLFSFSALLIHAQSPNWTWERSDSGTDIDRGFSIATDASGNVFVTGEFLSPTITFGSTTLTNAGNFDFYIVKYDASGNVLWAKSAGGNSSDVGYGISTDANGNVYATGFFTSPTITFGSTILTNASSSLQDIFIVKYDPSGNVVWAKREGGNNSEAAESICTDDGGNIFVTGAFGGPTITFGSTTLSNAGNENIFIVKYDTSGNVLWAKHAGGSASDSPGSICTDHNGNVLLTGSFTSPTISFGIATLTNTGNEDIFIAKYDASGNLQWAKDAGGTAVDYATGISADVNGNVFVTGTFYSTSLSFGSTTLTNSGYDDLFVAKYDAYGSPIWAKSAGGPSDDDGYGISVDANGNVFVTGVFRSPTISFGSFVLTCTGGGDVFVTKFDNSGNTIWAKSSGGISYGVGHGISARNGNVFIAGIFTGTITFGNDTLFNTGNEDIFVAKLDDLTGIVEENNHSPITVFPNPFSSVATLQSDQALENATLIIYNSTGQKVNEISSISIGAGQTIELQRNTISPGIYFIQLSQDNKIITTKKIVIRDN